MSSPPQGLRVIGTLPTTSLLLVAPQAVSRGAVADLSVTVFNPAGSSLSTQITIQVLGPNGYVFFDTVNVQVAGNSQTTILYDWTAPNQAGAYTIVTQTLPSQPGAYDSSTTTVQ